MKKLVEGFISFTHWPVSRKILLISATGIPPTVLAAVVNALINDSASSLLMNPRLLNTFMVLWIGVQVLTTLVTIIPARAGCEARWTAHLFTAVQAPFIAGLLYLYGTMGTPLVAIFPAIVLLWTVSLDERIGLFGMCNIAIWIALAGCLEWAGLLPHAPMLLKRSVDAQGDPVWFFTAFFHILVLLGFCMYVCSLLLWARRHQDKRLRLAQAALERANRLISRYVPAQLAEQITAGDYPEAARPQRRKLTIVFSDIEGFTALSEQVDPEVLAAMLDEYLSEMVTIADRYGGTVNQIVGDGMMIFFGAPQVTNDQDHALRAVRMALDMQARVREMGAVWDRLGLPKRLRVRIGINTGYASVGDFGSVGRKLYSGIGLQTNLASRIQASCEPGSVLISGTTQALIGDEIHCVCRGEMSVKGVHHPVHVYEVTVVDTAPDPANDPAPLEIRDGSFRAPDPLSSMTMSVLDAVPAWQAAS